MPPSGILMMVSSGCFSPDQDLDGLSTTSYKPSMSMTCNGSVISNFAQTSGIPQTSGGFSHVRLVHENIIGNQLSKILIGVIMYVVNPDFLPFLPKRFYQVISLKSREPTKRECSLPLISPFIGSNIDLIPSGISSLFAL